MNKALYQQLDQWHETGRHEEIVKAIEALPETGKDYDIINKHARALNNLSRYDEALTLLLSVRERGANDPHWHFRVGYSLYYMDGREAEAARHFERAIELGDDFPDTFQMLQWARKAAGEVEDEAGGGGEGGDFEFEPGAFATIALNMRLQPEVRHERIEDGLDRVLRGKKIGCVSGGGTALSENKEPEACDIEIDLADDSEATRQTVLTAVHRLGVAKGSLLTFRAKSGEKLSAHPVGQLEGFAVYIKTSDLPNANTCKTKNLSEMVADLTDLLSNNGALIRSHWIGPSEVALYFYGEGGVDGMIEKARPFLNAHPPYQKNRIVRLTE
ncbi:MAG: tetratricopeptide repeat protein [Opitutaceae bacterium]|jgi:tetratricopeptide (TPR) repeat protein|nr:tetratricopeptide repeat protein [Opitutaceae bacterium]